MAKIEEIVGYVDSLLSQVLIEALIVNVNLSDDLETGVNVLMNDVDATNPVNITGFNRGGNSTAVAATPRPNGGEPTAASETSAASVPAVALSVAARGFNYIGSYSKGWDLAVSAFASSSNAKILQTPRIQTSHAVPATFFNGQQIPYQSGSGSSYGGSYGGYGGGGSYTQFLDVGIDLSVTPYITPDDLVVMEITQTISELDMFRNLGGGGDGTLGMQAPQTSNREASSTISVKDGDTILLGGFIRSAKSETESGVPFLKDIPFLGNLFKNNSDVNSRSELLVLIRPTILKTPEDAALMVSRERQRLPGIREAEAIFKADEQARLREVEKKLLKMKPVQVNEVEKGNPSPKTDKVLQKRKTKLKPPF